MLVVVVTVVVVIAHGFGSHEPVPMGVPFSFAHSAVLSCSHSAWLSSLSFSPSELSPLSSAMQHRTPGWHAPVCSSAGKV